MADGRPGKFIVIEGLDGSGKSTQAGLLCARLAALGKKCVRTFEPTDGKFGSLARKATKGEAVIGEAELARLFAEDRREHRAKKIAPALAAGSFVVCDRHYHSNLAYQGGSPESYGMVAALNESAMAAPPDVVFFLDVPPETCARRLLGSRGEIGIYENIESLRELRRRYVGVFRKLAGRENIVAIDGAGRSEDAVLAEMLAALGL